MNRFVATSEETVILTAEEFNSPDRDAIIRQKRKLWYDGFNLKETSDLKEFHKNHPEVELFVKV